MDNVQQADLLFLSHIPFFCKLTLLFLHAFFTSLWATKKLACKLTHFFKSGQPISSYLPHHGAKKGTPTMGGIAIITGILIPSFFWSQISPTLIWAYITMLLFACIGVVDDITKLHQRMNKGISPRLKFILQVSSASVVATGIILYTAPHIDPYRIQIPLFTGWSFSTPYFYLPFVVFVMLSTTNAMNLTDGLDGLATRVISPVFYVLAILAFLASQAQYAQTYSILYIPQAKDITVLAIVAAGSCAGFLWYNRPKAHIFMGDTGSMALGALLAFCFIVIKLELLLPIAAFMMLFETLSVILQVASIRMRKRPLFLFAPYHHHLEKKGWSECSIVFCLGIVSDLFCVLALFLFFLHGYVHAISLG